MKSARRLEVVELEVQEAAHRLTRLEAAQEAGAAALKLARGSSDGGGLAALQGHLLAQQQKLQAHMEGLAAGIQQAIPGQVSPFVLLFHAAHVPGVQAQNLAVWWLAGVLVW